MGYVHTTPAWAGPLGATERRTYWGVVPGTPTSPGLPPHPRDVPLPRTFADWYATASSHLGQAEQADLGLTRLVAGGVLVLVQLVGALPGAAFLAASLGLPVERPPAAVALAGVALLAVGWAAWAWYRRRWTRAWTLRKAWSLAIHDEAVLALPVRPVAAGEERDLDTDPESVHPFRAVGRFPVAERPFVDAVYRPSGHTDRVRGREVLRGWLYGILLLGLVVLAVLSTILLSAGGTWPLLVFVVLLPPVAGAWFRHVRRMRFAHRLARTQSLDRQRWLGARLLSDATTSADAVPSTARTGDTAAPRAAHATETTSGPPAADEEPLTVALRVLPAQPPVTGRTVIPPGRWTLALSYDDRRVRLTPSDPAEHPRDLTVTGLISGVHPGVLGGRTPWYWLALADGTHVPVHCPPTRTLVAAAEFAGIPVVDPPIVV